MKEIFKQSISGERSYSRRYRKGQLLSVYTTNTEVKRTGNKNIKSAYYHAGADYVIDSYDELKALLHDLALKFA